MTGFSWVKEGYLRQEFHLHALEESSKLIYAFLPPFGAELLGIDLQGYLPPHNSPGVCAKLKQLMQSQSLYGEIPALEIHRALHRIELILMVRSICRLHTVGFQHVAISWVLPCTLKICSSRQDKPV